MCAISLASCARTKEITLNGNTKTYQPYGWADYEECKKDSILYQPCIPNVVLSVMCVETGFVPIWLTGWQLYEPIGVKK